LERHRMRSSRQRYRISRGPDRLQCPRPAIWIRLAEPERRSSKQRSFAGTITVAVASAYCARERASMPSAQAAAATSKSQHRLDAKGLNRLLVSFSRAAGIMSRKATACLLGRLWRHRRARLCRQRGVCIVDGS
jgi:hypothetical protein